MPLFEGFSFCFVFLTRISLDSNLEPSVTSAGLPAFARITLGVPLSSVV